MVVLSDYPVESDLTITWYNGSYEQTVTMSKGYQSNKYGQLGFSDTNTLQSQIKSITPSEDEIYKYTF
jgi:hypothetical protein